MKQIFVLASLIALVACRSYLFLRLEKCTSSGKTLTFSRCNLDSTRKVMMIQSNVTMKVFKFRAAASLHLLVGSDYKQMFKFADFDWCQFMSKKASSASPTAKIIIEAIRETSGNLFQECPYFGGYEANITMSKTIVTLLPSGLYKVTVEAKNEFDDDFFHVAGFVEIRN